MNVTTVGLDLAKNDFQVHGIDCTGKVTVRRSLRRRQMLPFFGKLEPCLIGIEARPRLSPHCAVLMLTTAGCVSSWASSSARTGVSATATSPSGRTPRG